MKRSWTALFAMTLVMAYCKSRSDSNVAATSGTGTTTAPKRDPVDPEPQVKWDQPLLADEMRLTILGTNDIHGGLEPSLTEDNQLLGGMAIWGGVAKAIRDGLNAREAGKNTVLTLDAGDQFQGTLPSNTNEGEAMLQAMNAIQYTAIVPGNHDYDFGPLERGAGGWRVDRSPDVKRRLEVIQNAAKISKAPFISANTIALPSYNQGASELNAIAGNTPCKAVLQDTNGAPVVVDLKVDLNKAKLPSFLKASVTVTAADGTKVAVIGLDNPGTPTSTTTENVTGLCFADEYETYMQAYESAKAGGAEIFILALHDGTASDRDQKLLDLVNKLKDEEAAQNQANPAKPLHILDAVVSAHTHYTYAKFVGAHRVPFMQSGSGGKAFGRIDLVWNKTTKKFDDSKTKVAGGIQLLPNDCDPLLPNAFCSASGGKVSYEDTLATPDSAVAAVVQTARKNITNYEPNATKILGSASGKIAADGFKDAPLTEAMSDALRLGVESWLQKAKAPLKGRKIDAAFMNASGLRAPIKPQNGTNFSYEELFNVLPFSNYAVFMELDKANLTGVLKRNITNCDYGFLGQSGLQIKYARNCPQGAKADPNAKLLSVMTLDGKVIVDADHPEKEAAGPFNVATLDFLADGGSGNVEFKTGTLRTNIDLARDVIANYYLQISKADLKPIIDDRWSQTP